MTLLVLGIDGAAREYVEEATERGLMPNFSQVLEDGAFGEMKSTVPPITIPAWVSMFSGLEPDKFDTFHHTELEEGEQRTVDQERWKGKMVWDILEARFGLNSVPGFSPVRPIEGYAVEGLPMAEDPDTYPENLDEELPPLEYPSYAEKQGENKREAFKQIFQKKRQVFKETPKDVDVKIEVYHLPDRTGHAAENRDQILETYGLMDEVIGERIKEHDDILFVSDHGFKHVERGFYPNTVLRDGGYLENERKTKSNLKDTVQRLVAPLAGTSLRPLLKSLKSVTESTTDLELGPGSTGIQDVDLKSSSAYTYRSGAASYADINIKDRSQISEIAELLRSQDCVEWVLRGEEVYDEPEKMPELVLKTESNTSTGSSLFPKPAIPTDSFVHSDTGIVAAYGESFRPGDIDQAEIVDVAPTIATYLGQEIDCDGEALDIFSREFEARKVGEELSNIDI